MCRVISKWQPSPLAPLPKDEWRNESVLHATAEENRIAGVKFGGVARIEDAAGEDVADFELHAEALDFFALDAED